MDTRETISGSTDFNDLLQSFWQSRTKVNLLIDDQGVNRTEGLIKEIHADDNTPFMELESGVRILLKTIIAVNGIFRSEYSEC